MAQAEALVICVRKVFPHRAFELLNSVYNCRDTYYGSLKGCFLSYTHYFCRFGQEVLSLF